MNKLLYIIIIPLLSVNLWSKEDHEYFAINFEGEFNNDTLTLYINNCIILNNKILKSDSLINPLDLRIIYSSCKGILIFESEKVDLLTCPKKKEEIKLLFLINDKRYAFALDLNKGTYFALQYINNIVKLRQNNIMLHYN